MQHTMILWPALVKHSGDDELTFLHNAQAWQHYLKQPGCGSNDSDLLIDSGGNAFTLSFSENDEIMIERRTENLSHLDIRPIIRAHFAALGECCISKISPRSMAECMFILGSEIAP